MTQTQELPAPPVPEECDLRDFPYMPLDVVRLRDSSLALKNSGEEFRAAVLLWCVAWHQIPAGSLPNDDESLAMYAGYGRVVREWLRVKNGALKGFTLCCDGRFYHSVICEKVLDSWNKRKDLQEKRALDRERKKLRSGGGIPRALPLEKNGIPTEAPNNSAGIPAENALKGEERRGEENKTLSAGADGTSEIPPDAPAKTSRRTGKRKSDAEHVPDPRHRPIVECLQHHYAKSNLDRKMPWDGLGAKRLATLLASNPSRPLEDFTLCVEHRFASEVNRSESPVHWIARLLDYFGAPLNKFNRSIAKPFGAMPDELPPSEPGPDEIGEPIPPDILDQMVLSKSKQFVDTWLSPARYERDGEIIRLYAPNHLFVEWLSGQALAELRTCFQCKLVEVKDVSLEYKRRSRCAGSGLPREAGLIPPGNGSGPAIRGSIEEHASIKLTAG